MRHLLLLLAALTAFSAFAIPVDSLLQKANLLIETSPDSAVALCARLKSRHLDINQKTKFYHTLGNALFAQGEMEKAKQNFREAISYARQAGDKKTEASVLSDLGVCYRITEKPDSALVSYRKALAILQSVDAPIEEAYLLTSIAIFYANQGRLDEAAKYGEQAFSLAKTTDEVEAIMYAGQTAGIVLYLKGEKEKGLAIEREMVGIAERHQLPRYILKTYASIIDIHYKDGRNDSVDHYMKRGMDLLSSVPEASVESIGFLEESYVVLTARGRYQESLDIQQRILDMKGAGTFMPFNKLYQRIARNYLGMGDIRRAGDAYERAIALTDSLHGLEIDQQLSEFDVKYETAKRELEISRLESEKSRHRTITAAIIAAMAIALVSSLIWWRTRIHRIRKEHELSNLRTRLKAIDDERSRIAAELHDGICNDLTGIELLMQSKTSNPHEILALIEQTRQTVRNISHELMPPEFNNVDFSHLLLALAAKSDDSITVSLDGYASPDNSVAFQLYRIIQEHIANIRKYSNADKIVIKAGNGIIVISDNGQSYNPEKGNGIGNQTMLRRAQSIGATLEFSKNSLKIVYKIR